MTNINYKSCDIAYRKFSYDESIERSLEIDINKQNLYGQNCSQQYFNENKQNTLVIDICCNLISYFE